MKVFLSTLGCKLNESEIEQWAREFRAAGDELVPDPARADICILNTCTVTAQAAYRSRKAARHLATVNPAAQILLTGCYATMSQGEAAVLPNVTRIIPNRDKEALVALAGELGQDSRFERLEAGCRLPEAASGALRSDVRAEPEKLGPPLGARTRAFVKIEDGCNMSCSYCIIPLARGHERSLPSGQVLGKIQDLLQEGYQEIILTGVQISDYSYDSDKRHGLTRLVAEILVCTGVPRLRLTSIAPWDLDDHLLDLFSDPHLCRHLHLSLQSGSDSVLRRMRRPYTTAQFAASVARARARVPGIGITTDVIVGFPGETEAEFLETCGFLRSLALTRVHLFPYSPRPGTAAAALPSPVSEPAKRERMTALRLIADAGSQQFTRAEIGHILPVLWENFEPAREGGAPSLWSGYTDNYIRVLAQSKHTLHNRILPARLLSCLPDGAQGELSSEAWASPTRALAPA